MRTSILPLALVVLVLAVVAFLPRREVGHPLVALVRVLFPSWRFFDDVQVAPLLLVRLADGDDSFGTWHRLLASPPRAWPRSLLWNPRGNLHLAEHVLLERLLTEVADLDDSGSTNVDELVSYELVVNLVRTKLAPSGGSAQRFQFKLVEVGADASDLLISREHSA